MDTAKVHIPAAQEELVAELARLGKPMVTVVIAGRAYCIDDIENASNALLYEMCIRDRDEVVATCIGHTHIDVAWLWTIDQVRQKSCRSFATCLLYTSKRAGNHFRECEHRPSGARG